MAYRSKKSIMDGIDTSIDNSGKAMSWIVARNTVRYIRPDGACVVRLHLTDIVTATTDGMFMLNSSGWKTVTTKDRINRFSPACVRSEKGIWMMNGATPFFDGVIIDRHGIVQNPEFAPRLSDLLGLKESINRFVKLVDTQRTLPEPDAGDCFICRFAQPTNAGPDHLLSHIDEGYLHGTLLVNAMRWAGYRDDQIGLHYSMDLRDTFKRALRRYLKHSLALGG